MSGPIQPTSSTVDDIERRLQAMLSFVESVSRKAGDEERSLAGAWSEANTRIEAIERSLTAAASLIDQQSAGHAESDEDVQRESQELDAACDLLMQTAGTRAEALEAEMVAGGETAAKEQAVNAEQQRQVESTMESTAAQVDEDSAAMAQEWLAVVEDAVAATEGTFENEAEETVTSFVQALHETTEWAEHVEGTAMPRLSQRLAEVRQLCEESLRSELDATMSRVGTELSGAAQSFSGSLDRSTGDLREQAESLIAEVAAHARDHAEAELRAAFDALLREALERVASEVVEQIATVQTGAATTTALSPILPELVAAKALIGAINDALEALEHLNPFD